MSDKNKTKRRRKDYPPNVSAKLFRLLKFFDFQRVKLAQYLGVNSGYLSQLLNKGIEPTDKTPTGREARRRMFLHVRKLSKRNVEHEHRKPVPDFIKKWKHLPTEERHKVIAQYIKFKQGG